jgi:glutamine amidotransferase
VGSRICILDYGSGNVASVKNALDRLRVDNIISNNPLEIEKATHLILPGVGAFSAAMDKIETLLPIEQLRKQIAIGKPFLGICVGMQVLAETGFEFGERSGLNLIPGSKVVELPKNISAPHVGWNSIKILQSHALVRGLENDADFYFVHSFQISQIPTEHIIATCDYGLEFPAIVMNDNLIGVQFHPEKSQRNGDLILRNYVESLS